MRIPAQVMMGNVATMEKILNHQRMTTVTAVNCEQQNVLHFAASSGRLDIVEVFGMVEEVPQNNPYCYNLPCAEDIERAEEINCQRATALAHIVEEASEL